MINEHLIACKYHWNGLFEKDLGRNNISSLDFLRGTWARKWIHRSCLSQDSKYIYFMANIRMWGESTTDPSQRDYSDFLLKVSDFKTQRSTRSVGMFECRMQRLQNIHVPVNVLFMVQYEEKAWLSSKTAELKCVRNYPAAARQNNSGHTYRIQYSAWWRNTTLT